MILYAYAGVSNISVLRRQRRIIASIRGKVLYQGDFR